MCSLEVKCFFLSRWRKGRDRRRERKHRNLTRELPFQPSFSQTEHDLGMVSLEHVAAACCHLLYSRLLASRGPWLPTEKTEGEVEVSERLS